MASGLPPNIVDQLIEAERIPVKIIEGKKTKEEDTLKLVGELEGKIADITKNLTELTNTRGFSDIKLVSGDANVIDGTVDPGAAPTGEYSIEVMQLAQHPGAMSCGFPDKDETQMGVGYIKFNTPQGMKEVYVNGENSTLDGVAKSINNSGTGLRASVIEDRTDKDNPFRLMVTGLSTGDKQQVDFPTIYMLDGDQDMYFEKKLQSQNAKIKVDGFEIEVPDNKVEGIIPGVTLDLKQAVPGRPIRLHVKENQEAITGKIKTFVESYNGALGWIQNQFKLTKGPSGSERMGPLGGDSLLRNIEGRLRRIVQREQHGTGSKITRLIELGIEFQRNGTLTLKEEKFNKELASRAKDVAGFFRGDGFANGFVPTLKREIQVIQDPSAGALGNRKRGISDKIKRMNTQIDQKTRQLEKKEEGLRNKFANLEQKMSALKGQGAAFGAMNQGGGGQG
ncbi:MAG: flagellar filament capping protein FliD [Bdellovibrionota bacterium]